MTANQAIEIINNAQNYSEYEYNFAAHQVREWKRHSEGLRNIQEIDEDVFNQVRKFDELKDELRGYYNKMDQYDTFDAKTCRLILKTLFEGDDE